jgi:hypothetical protein
VFSVTAYLVTVLSRLVVDYRVYQPVDSKESRAVGIKSMIVTLTDLLNTVTYVTFQGFPNLSYHYKIFTSKFFRKAGTLFNRYGLHLSLVSPLSSGLVLPLPGSLSSSEKHLNFPFPDTNCAFVKKTPNQFQEHLSDRVLVKDRGRQRRTCQ